METNKNTGSSNALKPMDIIALGEFEANGKTYFLEPQMSIERFKEAQKLELEITFSTTFKKHYKGLTELKAILNEANFVDAAVKLNDMMSGMHRVTDQRNHHPMMKYCALILNTHDEDRRTYDEKIMDEKINDWEEAGIPISSFFVVVLHSVNGFLETYREITQSTSSKLTTPLKENGKKSSH